MKKPLLILFVLLLTFSVKSANYFWKGGSGNWSDINHWATTSGGSTLHSFVPTPSDDVFFDAGSGFTAFSKVVNVNTNATCHNMTWSGALNNPQLTGSSLLNIAGALMLQPSMTFNVNNTNFVSTFVLGESITTNGVAIVGAFNFNGSGTWILQDNLNVQKLYCNAGKFNSNNRNINTTIFNSTGSTTRSLLLGTSIITIITIGNSTEYELDHTGFNLTLSASTSTIIMSGNLGSTFKAAVNGAYGYVIFNFAGILYGANGTSFNSVIFNGNGWIKNSSLFNNLTFSPGFTYEFSASTTNTIASVFNANVSTCGGWIDILSSNPGQQYFINMPATSTVNVSNCSIQNCTATGGAVFTATNSIDDGNNISWNFITPVINNLYWIGGSGNWSDGNHWSSVSGGAPSGCIPNPLTNVFFEIGSGLISGNNTITINTVQNCKNLTCLGSVTPPVITSPAAYTGVLNVFGSIVLQTGMTYNVLTKFKSSVAETITSNGVICSSPDPSSIGNMTFNGLGTWTFIDAFSHTGGYKLIRGTINTNNQTGSISEFTDAGSFPSVTKGLVLGSSVITINGGVWNYRSGSLNAGTSHLIFNSSVYSNSMATLVSHNYYNVTFNFAGGILPHPSSVGASFNKVTFLSNGNIYSGSFKFSELFFSPNCTYNIAPTQTITSRFNAVTPPCGGWITINGGTINMPSTSTVNVSQVIMTGVNAIGGAIFTASNSVDISGNTGWAFGAITTNSLYWVGGSGNWNDATHWNTANNGIYPSTNPCVPGPGDDVFFNANSGLISGSKTVSITASVYCRNITCVGSAVAPFILGTPNLGFLNIYGSTVLQAGGFYQAGFIFKSANAETITSNGATFSGNGSSSITHQTIFDGLGSWTFMDDFRSGATILSFKQGTINTNNVNVYASKISSYYASLGAFCYFNLGSSNIFITGGFNSEASWDFSRTNDVINSGTSHIVIYNFTNANDVFVGKNSQTYYDVTFNGAGNSLILGSGYNFHNVIFLKNGELRGNHTFNELTFTGRYTYILQNGFTQTVTSNFYPSGNPCFITFIRSTSAGVRGNINVQAGNINYDFVDIRDVDATPSFAMLNFAGHSTNSGNNLNMVFAPTTTVGLTGLGADVTLCQSALPITFNTTNFFPNPVTTFTWTGGITTNSLSVNSGGNYSVTVKYAADCLLTDAVLVTANPTPTLTIGGSAVTCNGAPTLLSVTGANTYTWSSPTVNTNTLSVNPIVNTTYSVIGTSTAGCVSSQVLITVTVSPSPTIAITSVSSPTICSGYSSTITPGGASTYTLTSATQTLTIFPFIVNPLANTTYTLRGTSSIGCPSSNILQQTITISAMPTIALSSITSNIICSGNSVTITPSGASTYTLLPSGITSSTNFTVNTTATTVYTISGTSSFGCVSNTASNLTQTVTVNATPTIALLSISSNTICIGNTVTIKPSGAITYTLLPSSLTSSTNFTISPTAITVYTISGTNGFGCVSNSISNLTTTITVNSTPTITLLSISSTTICSGATVSITPSGAFTYTLLPDNITGTSFTVTPTATTVYNINGESTAGCINTASGNSTTTITVDVTPTITAGFISSNTICSGTTVTITPLGASTYTLLSNAITGTSFTVSPIATTVYTINGESTAGCISTSSSNLTTTITVNSTPTITAGFISSNIICSGTTVSITPIGAFTYTLLPDNITGTSFTVTPTATTVYTINGESTAGCINTASGNLTTTITVGVTPTITVGFISSNTICSGATVTITPSGAVTYTLLSNAITGTSFTVNPIATTVYTINGSSSGGCASTSLSNLITTITVNSTPNIGLISITSNTICNGSNTIITPSGASSYTIFSLGTVGTSFTVSPTVTTTYTVIGTDNNGCMSNGANNLISTIAVSNLSITISGQQDVLCYGANTGSASVIATGGIATYSYSWSTTATTNTVLNLPAGIKTVTVTDAVNCTSTKTVIISEPISTLSILSSDVISACPNKNNGAITLSIVGGTPLYNVVWSNGNTGQQINNVASGNYTTTITDANNCSLTSVITVPILSVTDIVCEDLFIPEIFSPNGDGQNEVFEIKKVAAYPNNNLKIFNRWGSLVYSKNNYNNDWNGKANTGNVKGNAMLPAGTYYVLFDFGDTETKLYHGYVQLEY